MRAWVPVLLLASGCSSILGIEDFRVGGDGGTDPGDGFCLGPDGWKVCVPTMPTLPRPLASPIMFDTDVNEACLKVQPPIWKAAQQPDACFVTGSTIELTAEIRVIGSRPLVLFAADSITIGKQLDVASHIAGASRGAGAPSPACIPPEMGALPMMAGGGAGGSFMTAGARGGTGSSGGSRAGTPVPADSARPTKLRAGCNGSAGADFSATGGVAGRGGGAIYLVAGNRISVTGQINTSGSAGGLGGIVSGGGGGGSGGMIVLVAPAITGNGILVANGGGGGGGGGTSGAGTNGGEPVATAPQTPARGGGGGGGIGGDGFAGATAAVAGANGSPTTSTGGGGGGGGGGYIATSVTPPFITSPPAQPLN